MMADVSPSPKKNPYTGTKSILTPEAHMLAWPLRSTTSASASLGMGVDPRTLHQRPASPQTITPPLKKPSSPQTELVRIDPRMQMCYVLTTPPSIPHG